MLSLNRRVLLGLVCCAATFSGLPCSVIPCVAQGQQPTNFRINTDIYEDETKPPLRTTETLFFDGVYYDFDDSHSDWVTVIDPVRQRIVLIDRARRLKSEINMAPLQQMVDEARALLSAEQQKKLLSQSALTQDSATQEWVLGNEVMKYRCEVTQPSDPRAAHMYAEFADWSARLNAVNPPHYPAFMRLELNRELAEKNVMPKTVRRVQQGGGRKGVITARILATWRLSAEDETAIARVGSYLVDFKPVTQEEFYQNRQP